MMTSVYSPRRSEPRIHLRCEVIVEATDSRGVPSRIETTTVDVSPTGASVLYPHPIQVGDMIVFRAARYPFSCRAIVRGRTFNDTLGSRVIGVEFMDGARNPLVIWPADWTAA